MANESGIFACGEQCINKYKMSVGRVNEFDVVNGVWSSYADRLDMYFLVNKIEDSLKLPTLISVMGNE